jgi:hypothetical protein
MPINPPPESIASVLAGAPAVADDLRRAEVQRLASALEAERAALEAERLRLVGKYGAGSPPAQAAAARLAWHEQELAGLREELFRASIPVPETAPDRFVVYGRVLDAAGRDVRGVRVAAVNQAGKELAHAQSGQLGVFAIKVPLRPPASAEVITPAGEADGLVRFRLQADRKTGPSLKDEEVFVAAGDRLAYRELVLPEASKLPAPQARVAKKATKKGKKGAKA